MIIIKLEKHQQCVVKIFKKLEKAIKKDRWQSYSKSKNLVVEVTPQHISATDGQALVRLTVATGVTEKSYMKVLKMDKDGFILGECDKTLPDLDKVLEVPIEAKKLSYSNKKEFFPTAMGRLAMFNYLYLIAIWEACSGEVQIACTNTKNAFFFRGTDLEIALMPVQVQLERKEITDQDVEDFGMGSLSR